MSDLPARRPYDADSNAEDLGPNEALIQRFEEEGLVVESIHDKVSDVLHFKIYPRENPNRYLAWSLTFHDLVEGGTHFAQERHEKMLSVWFDLFA